MLILARLFIDLISVVSNGIHISPYLFRYSIASKIALDKPLNRNIIENTVFGLTGADLSAEEAESHLKE